MSKSLAHVAILASLVAFAANIHAADTPTSAPAAVKNHISDTERDRLMEEAMEKARKQLEESKAQSEAREKAQAEQAALREKKAAEEAEAKKRTEKEKAEQATAAKKAEEVRLAKQLAEAEKKSSEAEKSDQVKNLDSETAETASAEKSKSDDSARSKSGSDESRKVASSKDSGRADPVKSDTNSEKNSESERPRKAVIETVSTRLPGEGLSVKTPMPAGDSEREAEQRAARQSADAGESSRSSKSSSSHTYSGQVVGLLRGANGETKFLMRSEDMRMVQVVVGKDDVPAPGSIVSIRGRAIGGTSMSPVVNADSVDIETGQKLERLEESQGGVAAAPRMLPPEPFMPPAPIMGGPLPVGPMMMPGPMIGAPPPF